MRSPIIAFSIMAATVSPILVSAFPSPNGNTITHPRVTEVETMPASSGPLHLKRQPQFDALGMASPNLLASNPNSITSVLHEVPNSDHAGNSPTPNGQLSSDPLNDTPNTQDLKGFASNTVDKAPVSPVVDNGPSAPTEPSTPYQEGRVSPEPENGRHSGSKAEIANEM